jgi:hypothetical protein
MTGWNLAFLRKQGVGQVQIDPQRKRLSGKFTSEI